MQPNYDQIWANEVHQRFIESLDDGQLTALWDLLLIAMLADDELTLKERREAAAALASVPAFDGAVALHDHAVTAHLEHLYDTFESDAETLLRGVRDGLRDDGARRHAFRTVVQLIQADGFVPAEEVFVRRLGALLDLEPEVVDFAVMSAKGA